MSIQSEKLTLSGSGILSDSQGTTVATFDAGCIGPLFEKLSLHGSLGIPLTAGSPTPAPLLIDDSSLTATATSTTSAHNDPLHTDTLTGHSRAHSLSQLRSQVTKLRELSNVLPPQRSPGWYDMRKSRLTASDLAAALGECAYQTPFEVLKKKCGGGDDFKGNSATEWGVKYESVAIKVYEHRTKSTVSEFGLLPHPSIPFLGASPDGITGDGIMLEIKCPPRREIDGVIPRHYWIQMQLQLEVCELDRCDYEECKFEELYGIADFQRCSSATKGVLIETYDQKKDKQIYHYGPLSIDNHLDSTILHESRKWLENTEKSIRARSRANNVFFRRKVFFHLTKYSCVIVPRDRIWFAKVLPDIRHFWYSVCYYRTQSLEQLYLDHGKKQRAVKRMPLTDVEPAIAFLDSEPDDSSSGSSSSSGSGSESGTDTEQIISVPDPTVQPARKEWRRPAPSPTSIAFAPDSDDD